MSLILDEKKGNIRDNSVHSFSATVGNTGCRNTGNWNTGDWNTGNMNTGRRNTGNWNTGCRNTGFRNTGDWNTGNWNTGNMNIGCRNTGNWNTGDWNTGYLNTITPPIYMFNKPVRLEADIKFPDYFIFIPVFWIDSCNMSEEEKAANPDHKTTGGYLKIYEYRDAWKESFRGATKEDVALTLDLPNFDYAIFEEISGITKEMIDQKLKNKEPKSDVNTKSVATSIRELLTRVEKYLEELENENS